jgi:hypothetical protein
MLFDRLTSLSEDFEIFFPGMNLISKAEKSNLLDQIHRHRHVDTQLIERTRFFSQNVNYRVCETKKSNCNPKLTIQLRNLSE